MPPVLASLLKHRCGVIEDLAGVGPSAPGCRLPGVGQQIFGSERNALQRPAEALALHVVVNIASGAASFLAKRKRERIVARPEPLQTIGKCVRQLERRKLFQPLASG